MPGETTIFVQQRLARLKMGDEDAWKELLARIQTRLDGMVAKMLRGFPGVRARLEADDIRQDVNQKLINILKERQVRLEDARHFFRLVAKKIRERLLDLARKPNKYVRAAEGQEEAPDLRAENPKELDFWEAVHHTIDRLPDDEQELWDLLYYQELSQAETAELLNSSQSTVSRDWEKLRRKLGKVLQEHL